MSVSIPGMMSALAMKPMPPMLARSIAGSLVDMAARSQTAAEVEAPKSSDASANGKQLDQRA